jgi:hypothetical protein
MQFTAFRDGKSIGSFTEEQLKSAVAAGVLRPTDTYFGEGMSAITPLSELAHAAAPKMPPMPRTAPASAPAHVAPPQTSSAAADVPVLNIDWDTLVSGPVPASCAHCRSPEIKSVQMVYKMGKNSGSMAGFSLSGDVGVAATENISGLAEELAPPTKAMGGCAIFFLGLIIASAVGLYNQSQTAFGLILALSITVTLAFAIHARKTYAKESYLWRNRWICLKCGHKFLSVAPAALAVLKEEA